MLNEYGTPIVVEPEPPVQGPMPPVQGPKPPAQGPKPPLQGPKPPQQGPKPPLQGPSSFTEDDYSDQILDFGKSYNRNTAGKGNIP